MALQTLFCNSRAEPLISPGDPPTLIFNNDITNVLYIGDDLGVTAAGNNVSQIAPLGYAVFDGTSPIWGVTAVGIQIEVFLMPGATQASASPAQIAEQISALGLATATNQGTQITQGTTQIGHQANIDTSTFAAQDFLGGTVTSALLANAGLTVGQEVAALIASGLATGTAGGVPLLVHAGTITTGTTTFTGAGSQTLGPFNINQIGYDGTLQVWTGSGILATVTVILQWLQGGVVVDQDNFHFFPGTNANPQTVYLKGPTKGSQVQITFLINTATTVNFLLDMYQNSRVYHDSLWRTYTGFLINSGAQQASYDSSANMIGSTIAVNCNAGATQGFILPMYNGKCSVVASTSSGAADMQVLITPTSIPTVGVSVPILNIFSNGAGVTDLQDIVLPRAQCEIDLKNNNAAAKNVQFAIVAAEY